MAVLRCLQQKEGLPDLRGSIVSAVLRTFVVLATANMLACTAWSANRSADLISTSPKIRAQVGKCSACVTARLQQCTSFPGS